MELETAQQPSIEDSDDEDLPDIFTSAADSNEEKYEVIPGDIVWAEYRKVYWPALVRTVYKKHRKASVWYLDSPKRCFKVPFTKIKNFSDPKVSTMVRQQVERSPVKAMHEKVLFNAITYIRRKTEGHKDDPAAYFDLSEPYLIFQDPKFLSQNNENNIKNGDEPQEIRIISNDDSDEESVFSSDDEEIELNKRISRFIDLADEDEDSEKSQAIVDYITAGYVDKHLLRIRNKKTPSEYHEIFEDAMKTDRKKIFSITACNIVKNLQKLNQISFYLLNFYEKVVEGGKCEMLDYVTSVWLPEAINKADEMLKGGKLKSDSPSKTRAGARRKLFPSDKLEIDKEPGSMCLAEENKNQSHAKNTCKPAVKRSKSSKKVNDGKNDTKLPIRSSPRNLRPRK